ncbi:MAG TPA: transglutaminase-like domain-containing protein [Pyrinomonadaceae bacterium]|nr:transglutaminase-like domain-containing protein [Pyrinomonadaceae bacterium]
MTPSGKLRAERARRLLAEEAGKPAALVRLDRAALLIGAEDEAYRNIDVEKYLRQLDELAAEARSFMEDAQSNETEAFNYFLFELKRFSGNQLDYYDPRNSFLNEVMDRRVGIPITLSVIYIEVGRRAGLDVEGVGLPGHFIVRVRELGLSEALLVDPFHGVMLTREDCQDRLDTVYDGLVSLSDEHMRPVSAPEILVRMLTNLKGVYTGAKLYRQSLACAERILLLAPDSVEQHRDRGVCLAKLERFEEAVRAIELYLQTAPDAVDRAGVSEYLDNLRRQQAMRN